MGENINAGNTVLCKYLTTCPSCGDDITDFEVINFKRCLRCKEEKKESQFIYNLNVLQGEIKTFIRFAYLKFNIQLTAIQINWAKKFFLNQSYSIIFPPGTGKTTFGIVLATYLYVKHRKRSYIILSSQQLLEQVCGILHSKFPDINILAFGKVSKKKSDLLKEQIKNGDFSILITTSMFLNKNINVFPVKFFDMYFVDDGDLFIRYARNVDYLLKLMGFSDDDINKTSHLVKLRRSWYKMSADDYEKQKTELHVQTEYKGSVIIASAAGIPHTQKIELFYHLLGFELGKPNIAIRKVTDTYVKLNGDNILEVTEEWMKKLGKGGLIFVSSVFGRDLVDKLHDYLTKKNIKVDIYDKKNAIQNLIEERTDYILGIASYNNPLARGIDLPLNIWYCIFVGIPKFVFNLKMENIDKFLRNVLGMLRNVFVKQLMYPSSRYDRLLKYLKKGGKNLPDNLREIRNEIINILKKEENIRKINESSEAALVIHNGNIKISVSDITGYLQASGRTSRLSKLGITRGLSLILCDDEKTLNHLIKKIRFFIDDFNIVPADEHSVINTVHTSPRFISPRGRISIKRRKNKITEIRYKKNYI